MKKVFNALYLTSQGKFVMKYSMFLLLLAGVIIILGAWKNESPGSKTTANRISAVSAKKKNVPFSAHFETMSTGSVQFPILQLHSTGRGLGLHIGKSTLEAFPAINLITLAVNGTLTITAANGDEIFASFTGTRSAAGPGQPFTVNATYTITGGTGRFENASGSFEGISTGIVGNPAGTASYVGDISY